jgi:hypothetical protein
MTDNASALPAAAQRKAEQLRQAESGTVGTVVPAQTPNSDPGTAVPAAPAASTLPPADGVSSTDQKVTLSREDYNALVANADKAANAIARLEQTQIEIEEARHRLTELEARGKGSNVAPAPSAPGAPAPANAALPTLGITDDVEIDPKEEEQFGESRPYIEKVAAKQVAKLLNPLLGEIRSALEDLGQRTETVGTQFARSQEDEFKQRVNAAVPDLAQLIDHKHWKDFLLATNDVAGATYQQLLAYNIEKRNVAGMKAIYDEFKKRYGLNEAPAASTGYEGAPVGGEARATNVPGDTPAPRLKWSDRKRAGEDYRFGRNGMTYEKLQAIDAQFKAAAEKNLVDMNA